MVFISIRIIPAERLYVLTEIVVICLCKELQQRSGVATLCHSNGNHTPIYKADCCEVSYTRLIDVWIDVGCR
jgi:hypothetical protein